MDSMYHPPVRLILKNDTWVPRRERRPSILDRNGISLKETLGEGSYAKVKLAYSNRHDKDVAVKEFNKRRLPVEYLKKFLPREIKAISTLRHPNIVNLLDVSETSSYVYLIMELAENGDLLDYINKNSYQTEEQVRQHFKQFLSAMSACHQQFIVHRDIKCENILLDRNNNIKLADFGFARESNKQRMLNTFCGSFAYTSPEMVSGKCYDGFAADCWSMGVILYCMLCAELPYQQQDLLSLAKGDKIPPITFHIGVSEAAQELVRALLNPDPVKRLSCKDMQEIDWARNEEELEISETEYPYEIIGASNTIACSSPDDGVTNVLSKVVRPSFGKTFADAISRQKKNLMAINAFKHSPPQALRKHRVRNITRGMSFPVRKRKMSLVTEILESERIIITERRNTIAEEAVMREQIRRKSLVKDMELSAKMCTQSNKSAMPLKWLANGKPLEHMSKVEYLQLLERQRTERTQELSQLSKSFAGQLAQLAHKQQVHLLHCALNDVWYETDSGEDKLSKLWVKKCLMACTQST